MLHFNARFGEKQSFPTTPPRIWIIDAIRGLAIIGVVMFHLVWDLAFLGLTSSALAIHPLWIVFGRSLAGTFMLLVGVSLVLACRHEFNIGAFLRRLGVLFVAALAISIVTRIVFPSAFVYFGILHAIAVASLIGLLFLRAPVIQTVIIGAAIIVLGMTISDPAFDPRWLAWIGFASSPAVSNDFVPVFPWVGLTLIGMALAKISLSLRWTSRLARANGPIVQKLAVIGRWSLAVYLLHQPLLLAVLIPVSWLTGR